MPKKYSPKAEPRNCPECGKHFKPMTEKQWKWNRNQHNELSLRHRGLK